MDPPVISDDELKARQGGGEDSGSTAGTGTMPMTQAGSSSSASGGSPATGTGGSGPDPVLPSGGSSGAPPTSGGQAPVGGQAPSGGSASGGMAGTGGMAPVDNTAVAKNLDGLRIDDPCTGAPSTAHGATCTHVMNPYHVKKDVTIAGTAGTTYDVVLRIRGVVEPTKISGGTRSDTTTVTIEGQKFRTSPYTVGGTPGDVTYQPWLLTVSSPAQNYFFNDYGATAHITFLLDYQVTIPMAANATVTLDVNDGNDHEIDNYDMKKVEGIPGSMNLGQFVQINVVSVTPR